MYMYVSISIVILQMSWKIELSVIGCALVLGLVYSQQGKIMFSIICYRTLINILTVLNISKLKN